LSANKAEGERKFQAKGEIYMPVFCKKPREVHFERQNSRENDNQTCTPVNILKKTSIKDVGLPEFCGKWRSSLTESRYFFSRGILHNRKSFLREKRFFVMFRLLFVREYYQINYVDCHFFKNTGFRVMRIAIFPADLAFPLCRTSVFFFQRHSA
jgi:hypothetical protein